MSRRRSSLTFSAFKYLRWIAFDFCHLLCKTSRNGILVTCSAAGKFPGESFLPEWNILHRAKSSHMVAPVCVCVKAVGGQGRGWAWPGPDGSGWLWVADLGDHVVGLPALQFLPHQPLHLLPVDVCVPSHTLILTDDNRSSCSVYLTCTQETRLRRISYTVVTWFLWICSSCSSTVIPFLPNLQLYNGSMAYLY